MDRCFISFARDDCLEKLLRRAEMERVIDRKPQAVDRDIVGLLEDGRYAVDLTYAGYVAGGPAAPWSRFVTGSATPACTPDGAGGRPSTSGRR